MEEKAALAGTAKESRVGVEPTTQLVGLPRSQCGTEDFIDPRSAWTVISVEHVCAGLLKR